LFCCSGRPSGARFRHGWQAGKKLGACGLGDMKLSQLPEKLKAQLHENTQLVEIFLCKDACVHYFDFNIFCVRLSEREFGGCAQSHQKSLACFFANLNLSIGK
jgi:hypothetical protein